MGRRGKRVCWVVIVVSTAFIMGYLVKYGGADYARGAAPAPVATAALLETRPALPLAPTPARSNPPTVVRTRPAVIAPPTLPKPKAVVPAPTPLVPAANGRAQQSQPVIKFVQTEFDFGTVYQEQKVRHDYAFVNVGGAPLKITDAASTCSCAVDELPQKEIAPGQHGVIPVTFDSGRLRDRVTKHIYVTSNDPANPRTVLTLTAVVKVEAEINPAGVYFARLPVGKTADYSVNIRPAEVKQLRLRAFESSDAHVALARPLEQLRPGLDGGYTVVLRIGPYSEHKLVDAKVKITTDLKHQPVLTIPVYGWAVNEDHNESQGRTVR